MEHAKLSPSSSSRWLVCPGSIRLTAGIPDPGNIYAAEGTKAHDLAEKALNSKKKNVSKVATDHPQEMIGFVQEYVDYITAIPGKLYVEVKVNLTDYIPDGFGTSDAVIVDDTTVHIADLKYGMRSVSPRNNSQAMIYALGVVSALKKRGQVIKKVIMHICQPRIDAWGTHEITAKWLLRWGKNLKPKADLCLTDDAPLNPTDDACRYCLAAPTCPALSARALEVVGGDFEQLPDPDTLPIDKLAFVMANKKLVETWLGMLETRVAGLLEQGTEVPGFKLVESRTVRRYTDNAEAVLEKLLGPVAYQAPKLITLGQAEKLLTKKRFETLGITVKPEGKPMVAPETDGRPAIALTAEDFGKL